jgi:peptidoglycan-N-acetylmuramic acid deacetylase
MYMILTKKNIVFIILSLALIIGFTFACKHFISASKNTNWGLSFKKQGERPTGNATPEYLKEFNSYFIAPEGNKKIYITFDAGYEAGYTPKILGVLEKHNVKATFFVVGTLMKSNPELIKQIDEKGHIVANHSMHHPNMSKMSTMEDFKKEIEPLEELYKEITGKDMKKFYRPPQGIFSETNLKMANELGYKTIFWSLAYVDWYKDKQPSKEEALNKIMSRIHDGAIILLHSTSKTNSEILDELLTKLEKQGYTFGTLEEL